MLITLAIVAGTLCLYYGGDLLVDGGAHLGRKAGISPLVVGLTVVSFGTSMPELATTLEAASRGSTSMAFGNVIGSNVANIGLALGLAALLQPLTASRAFMLRDVPTMLISAGLLWPLAKDGIVAQHEGAILLGLLVVYLGVLALMARRDKAQREELLSETPAGDDGSVLKSAAKLALGIGLLVGGAEVLIYGCVEAAHLLDISERIIGLTVVALGTSLPEIASTAMACLKGEDGIAIGNVVGSNIFNILAILGTTASVHAVALETGPLPMDVGAVMLLSVLIPVLGARGHIGKPGGVVLLVLYVGYIATLAARG